MDIMSDKVHASRSPAPRCETVASIETAWNAENEPTTAAGHITLCVSQARLFMSHAACMKQNMILHPLSFPVTESTLSPLSHTKCALAFEAVSLLPSKPKAAMEEYVS